MMSRNEAAKRWELLIGGAMKISFDEAFARLEKARVVINGQIDMSVLSRAVIEQRQELISQDTSPSGLYVSTVHRSKGLEFDEVYLFDPSKKKATWQGKPEEVRVVYVAATRAKSKLSLIRMDSKALGMSDRQWKTPVKQHPHEFNSQTNTNRIFLDGLIELDTDSLLEDIHGVTGDTCSSRIAARQNALWDHYTKGGQTLNAIRDGGKLTFVAQPEGNSIPICHASLPLTSDFFGLGMRFRTLNLTALCGTPVMSLATVAYQADDDEATKILGPGRLLMAPVLRGWGTVVG